MTKHFLLKSRWLVTIILLTTLAVPHTWATSARISAYGSITSGKMYFIGATVSSTDYYFKANGGISTGTGLGGVSTTTPNTDGTVVKITGSSTSWKIQFTNDNYMTLSSSKANGKYESQTSSATWTFSNNNSLIRMTINSHVFQRNSNAGTTAFGSYGDGGKGYQKDVWLEPARKVTYNGNGNTSGSAPNPAYYLTGSTVTVASNTGSLAKTGYTFGGWNTQADGNGTNYTAGSGTFSISGDITLYAKWVSAGTSVSYSKAATTNGSFLWTCHFLPLIPCI